MQRVPDVTTLVLQVLRAAVDDVEIGSKPTHDVAEALPQLVARTVPGGTGVDERFGLHRHQVQIDAYAADRAAACALAEQARQALVAAWSAQTVVDEGWICSIDTVSSPVEVTDPDQPDQWSQVVGRYTLIARAPIE